MSDMPTFQVMRCSSCGAPLKIEDPSKPIECVYCGSTSMPVSNTSASGSNGSGSINSSSIRIEGQKNPASTLAYIENYFEDYDWYSFLYSDYLTLPEVDEATEEYKIVSADDVNTWKLEFESHYCPFVKKFEHRTELIDDVVSYFNEDDLTYYSVFDTYKKLINNIMSSKESVALTLEKAIEKMTKYGVPVNELATYKSRVTKVRELAVSEFYSKPNDIPQVAEAISRENAAIINRLMSQGINAETEYARAKAYVAEGRSNEALSIFKKIRGYSDSIEYIKRLDRLSVAIPYIEVASQLYMIKGDSLYMVKDGVITPEPVIGSFSKVITSFGTLIYYFDMTNYLCVYDPKAGKTSRITKMSLDNSFHKYDDQRLYLLTAGYAKSLISVNFLDGTVNTIFNNVKQVESFYKRKNTTIVVCSTNEGVMLHDFEHDKNVLIASGDIQVRGCYDDKIIYTTNFGSAMNKNLYVKNYMTDEPAVLIEKNIYNFIRHINDTLFYSVGNTLRHCTICININGTNRREWPLSMHTIIAKQGDWIYFTRTIGRNTVIGKTKMDCTGLKVIAGNVDRYVGFANGYIYFIDDYSSLVRVRPDGKRNVQVVCDNVARTLDIKETGVIFVSNDDVIDKRKVESIYLYDSKEGLKKLVYDVCDVEKRDDDSIYFTEREMWKTTEQGTEYNYKLYKLDVNNYDTSMLSETKNIAERKHQKLGAILYFIIAAIVCLAVAIFCFVIEAYGAGVTFLCLMGIAIIIAIAIKNKRAKKNSNVL